MNHRSKKRQRTTDNRPDKTIVPTSYFLLPTSPIPLQQKNCMAEDLSIVKGTKEEQYKSLIPQIEGLLTGETDVVANMANVAAALKEQFGWLWVGFYVVKQQELVLAPFQGPVACTRIKKGRGVCGTAWQQAKTLIVRDVEKFPGHIACSSLSKSEIVVPVIKNDEVVAVLDADNEEYDLFDETDQQYLEEIARLITF
jgi:L-methionine (R)-S-oxide reductase